MTMSDPFDDGYAELGIRLEALATEVVRQGFSVSVAEIRGRGERRRRNARAAVVAAAVAVVAVVGTATVYARGGGVQHPVQPPVATPTSTPSPSTTPSTVPSYGVPDKTQAVWLRSTEGAQVLTTATGGDIVAVDEAAAGDAARFVLTELSPGAHKYLLKTADVTGSGEPGCLAAAGDRLILTACDAAKSAQRVTVLGERAPYVITVGGKAIRVAGAGVSLVPPAQGSGFTFVPRGAASNPLS